MYRGDLTRSDRALRPKMVLDPSSHPVTGKVSVCLFIMFSFLGFLLSLLLFFYLHKVIFFCMDDSLLFRVPLNSPFESSELDCVPD